MPIPQAITDRYRILGEPTAFPLGLIHTGLDPFTNRAVTVYEIPAGNPAFRSATLVTDMRDANRITHPNLQPALTEAASQSGNSYLVTAAAKGVRLDHLPADKGLSFEGALLIARTMANVLEYCWKSKLSGLGFGPQSMFITDGGIRIASIAECRMLARAEGRSLDGIDADTASFTEILACVISHCRRAGSACEPLEQAARALVSDGIARARQILYNEQAPAADGVVPPEAARRLLDPGDILFKEGDSADDTFFVLQSGLIQIVMADPTGNEVFLDFLHPGQLVGEMAVIADQPRMASARAIEPCSLLLIRGESFRKRLANLDSVAVKLIETLSSRLRKCGEEVIRLKSALGSKR